MAQHYTTTVKKKLPRRRWSKPVVITLSDTISGRNLQQNGTDPYRFLMNVGAAGTVMIVWEPDDAGASPVSIWINQGEVIEGGHWIHAKSTGSSVGATDLRGLIGFESVDS